MQAQALIVEQSLAQKYRQLTELQRALRAADSAALDGLQRAHAELMQQVNELEEQLFAAQAAPAAISDDERREAQRLLALPRWFTLPMIGVLFPGRSEDQRQALLSALLDWRDVVETRSPGRYRLIEQLRRQVLTEWEKPDQRTELARLSGALAAFCDEQQARASSNADRTDWRMELLYHSVAAGPDHAFEVLGTWFDEAVGETEFDLNTAHCLLQPLEERSQLLEEMEKEGDKSERWSDELDRRRDYLAARAYWTAEWYRTITYLPRAQLIEQLEHFFKHTRGPSDRPAPWMLNLHAPPGHGKTVTIDWLLARYALPRGYACARFDYDSLSSEGLSQCAEQPERMLVALADNLNAQRARKLDALSRQGEVRRDPVFDFIDLLREAYAGRVVLLFIDTLEVLIERSPPGVAGLRNLLRMLRRMRYGDTLEGGTRPGLNNVRVVISGRHDLLREYRQMVTDALDTPPDQPLPILASQVCGFNRAEGEAYLSQKRRLTNTDQLLVTDILDRATDVTPDGECGETGGGLIVPLKLAMYADMVKGRPDLKREDIYGTDRVDLLYLVKRIVERIDNLDLIWVVRYGVIFRRLDAPAAQAVMTAYIHKARTGSRDLDDPDLDPEVMRKALARSRERGDVPLAEMEQLLQQLTRYSWISRDRDDHITFHQLVRDPQLMVIQRQPVHNVLQRAAFDHYRQRAEDAGDNLARAEALREAVYHGLQLGEVGAAFWREQLGRYMDGPSRVLSALVDEAFRVSHELARGWLTEDDRRTALLALARVLVTETETDVVEDGVERDRHLQEAEEDARAARDLIGPTGPAVQRFEAFHVTARIALARHQPQAAIEAAQQCVEAATALDAAAEAAAAHIFGRAQVAISAWDEAIDSLTNAYALARQAVKDTPEARPTLQAVRVDLVDRLLDNARWQEARALIAEARRELPRDPAVLAQAGRLALKEARLADADAVLVEATTASDDRSSVSLLELRQFVQLYRTQPLDPITPASPPVAAAASAAVGDWLSTGTVLRAWQETAADDQALEIINVQLQYQLEIARNWSQVLYLESSGISWAHARAANDPAVSRFALMRQYIDFERGEHPLEPSFALRECGRRWQELVDLPTPEARVRAKALLLIVNFHGGHDPTIAVDGAARLALDTYRNSAVWALHEVLDLLPRLTPFDQIDVMRTLAVLPGWSSGFANHLAASPAERWPKRLLQGYLVHPGAGPQALFLKPLLELGGQTLDDLVDQLTTSLEGTASDWPLFYTSAARLFAALGRHIAAQEFAEHIGPLEVREQPQLALDLMAADWRGRGRSLAELILHDAPSRSGTLSALDMLLHVACLALGDGGEALDLDIASNCVDRFFVSSDPGRLLPIVWEDAHILRALVSLRYQAWSDARRDFETARIAARDRGDAGAIDLLEAGVQYAVEREARRAESPARTVAPVREGLILTVQPVESGLNVGVSVSDGDVLERPRDLALVGLSGLLPSGGQFRELPDLDTWKQLLNPDVNGGRKLEEVGAIFTRDVLHNRVRSQGAFLRYLDLGDSMGGGYAMRLNVRSRVGGTASRATDPRRAMAVDGFPWEMLYLEEHASWLFERVHLSREQPPPNEEPLRGQCIAILPDLLENESAQNSAARWLREYSNPSFEVLDAAPLLAAGAEMRHGSIDKTFFSPPPKLVYLCGAVVDRDVREGVVLDVDRRSRYGKFTPDALAEALHGLGLRRTLIVLETFSTGTRSEDVRVLLLRNAYAAALARLGSWSIVAIGPRPKRARGRPAVDELIRSVAREDELTSRTLEELVSAARRIMMGDGSSIIPGSDVGLFYSAPPV